MIQVFCIRYITRSQHCQINIWRRRGKRVQYDAPHGRTEVLLINGHCLADCPRLPVFFCLTVHSLPFSHFVKWGICVDLDPPCTNGHSHSPEDWSFSATHSHLVHLLFSSTNRFILAGSLTVCTGTYHWVKRYASSKFNLWIWLTTWC